MMFRSMVVLICVLTSAITARANRGPSTQPNDAAMKTHKALVQAVEDYVQRDETLESLANRLSDVAKLPLDVQWDDLSAAGLKKETRGTVNILGGSVADVLDQIFEGTAAERVREPGLMPQFVVLDDGRVVVATKRTIYSRYVTERRYDVADLVTTDAQTPADRAAENAASFVEVIQKIVPLEWAQNRDELGGTVRSEGTSVVIVQTDDGHRRVAAMIAGIRHARTDEGKREAAQRVDDTRQRMAAKSVGDVSFTGEPINNAFQRLHEVTGENIFINWRTLDAAQIKNDSPITLDLSDLTLDKALDKMLAEIGGNRVKLGWTVDEGVISISTADDLAKNVFARVYDIRGVIKAGRPREPQIAELMKKVLAIDPPSWQENGGQFGSVRELAGMLIVTQTPEVHERIAAMLREREPRNK